jgi:hypothetical protein
LGKQFEHPCFAFGRHAYHFTNSGAGMREMVMSGADGPERTAPIETVKELVLARKRYIDEVI